MGINTADSSLRGDKFCAGPGRHIHSPVLAGLQQDGKLIGVISHVSALNERISTQINVTKVSGGRSTVAGPGCQRIS